jgi:putative membrane protein
MNSQGEIMNLVLHLITNTLAVLTGSYLLKGVRVADVKTAVVVSIVLGLVNTFVKPILILLTLPVTILTLGLFLLVINAFMILLTAKLVPGFRVESIWWAMGFSIIIAIVSSFLGTLL